MSARCSTMSLRNGGQGISACHMGQAVEKPGGIRSFRRLGWAVEEPSPIEKTGLASAGELASSVMSND